MESYIVRVWRPSGGGPPGLRGVVERVGTGIEVTFHDLEELGFVLEGQSAAGRGAAAPERAFGPDPRART